MEPRMTATWNGLCRGCRWWQCDIPEQYKFGFCHRLPPTTTKHVTVKGARFGNDGGEVSIIDTNNPAWPNTSEDDWCGEWAGRDTPLPERNS